MKIALFILLLAAVPYCEAFVLGCIAHPDVCLEYYFGDKSGKVYQVTAISDGRQLHCVEGDNREIVIHHSVDNKVYTCDEVAPTDPHYRLGLTYPKAPPNAKETDSFVAQSPFINRQVSCSRMLPGDDAKIAVDTRYYIITDIKRNVKYVCIATGSEE